MKEKNKFQSPQWGSNSKVFVSIVFFACSSFSPRNGEVILKRIKLEMMVQLVRFSPRNGEVILKDVQLIFFLLLAGFSPRNGEVILKFKQSGKKRMQSLFQSPQWGSNSKGRIIFLFLRGRKFQSPQWGSNSKVKKIFRTSQSNVSVPAMGK